MPISFSLTPSVQQQPLLFQLAYAPYEGTPFAPIIHLSTLGIISPTFNRSFDFWVGIHKTS